MCAVAFAPEAPRGTEEEPGTFMSWRDVLQVAFRFAIRAAVTYGDRTVTGLAFDSGNACSVSAELSSFKLSLYPATRVSAYL